MDDENGGGTLDGFRNARRKRARPSANNDGDGDNSADLPSDGNPTSRPLTILAGCALQGNPPYAQPTLEGQNQPIHLHPAVGFASPSQALPQNAPPPQGMNHAMIQNFVHTHPNVMPAGQSAMHPAMMGPQNAATMQAQPTTVGAGSLLRPFGMSPQELLNYAVLVNIVHHSISQGNAAISQLALNCSQAMMAPNSHQSEGTAAAAMQAGDHPSGPHNATIGNDAVQVDGNNAAGDENPDPLFNLPQQQNGDGGSESTTDANECLPNAGAEFLPATLPNHYLEDTRNNGGQRAIVPYAGVTDAQNVGGAPNPAQFDVPGRRRMLLWTPEDEQRLSTQQCWLRRQIETFPASARDVSVSGRNRLVDIGQVGIQCVHCKQLSQEGRGKGSSYFPASLKSIYQSAQNMLQVHFKEHTCPLISRRLLQEMTEAGETSSVNPRMAPKAGKARPGGGKAYWEASAAHALGLVDTTVGIRYSDDHQHGQPLEAVGGVNHDLGVSFHAEASVLTTADDKATVTDFCYILMSQFDPYCRMAPARKTFSFDKEEWHSDIEKEESLPSIGVVCKFCRGESGRSKGIFLSSKADTMSRNKNLARMYNHLLTCAPEALNTKLHEAKNIHLPQSDQLKKGWKKAFFDRVCERLLDALDLDEVHEDHHH